MLLDTKTTLAYYVITSLTLAVLMLVAFRGRMTPALRLWLGNLLSQALGWFMLTLQEGLGSAITTTIGVTAISLSYAFLTHAIMRFYEVRPSRYWPYWSVPVVLAAALVWYDSASTRQVIINICYAVQLAGGAVFLISRKDKHLGLRGLMAICGAIATVLLFARAGYAAVHFSDVPPLLHSGPMQSLTFSIGFVLRLVFTCGFLLLIESHNHDELTRLATLDSLTGIYNRRTFINLAEAELARSQRNKQPLALMLIDLDHFKAINDTYGHQTGDQVLQQLRTVSESCMRSHDIFGRYGGEEFCIMAPETNREGALILAERLRTALADNPISIRPDLTVCITASIGVACMDGTEKQVRLDELLSRADQALYRAKDAGRNRVVLA